MTTRFMSSFRTLTSRSRRCHSSMLMRFLVLDWRGQQRRGKGAQCQGRMLRRPWECRLRDWEALLQAEIAGGPAAPWRQ